jgi:uncharacterized protein (DUF885 family)
MKKIFLFVACAAALSACNQGKKTENNESDKRFAAMCETYYQDGLKLSPIAATYIGDERYNDLLPNDGSQAYIAANKSFNERYLDSLKNYDRETLNSNDKLSFDYMKDQITMSLEGFKYHTEYFPFNQMFALPLILVS